MRRALSASHAGDWPERDAIATATLTFDDRHRRRIKLMADNGLAFLLDLEETTVLQDGDGLKLDDGTWLRVAAAGEEVCDISCAAVCVGRRPTAVAESGVTVQIAEED